jgi:hypothetical protein
VEAIVTVTPTTTNLAAQSFAVPGSFSPDARIQVVVKTSTTSARYVARLGRVRGILDTWYRFGTGKIWFVTDEENEALMRDTGDRLRATPCPSGHKKPDLCCKLEHEFKLFHEHRHKSEATEDTSATKDDDASPPPNWFCHIDDDMYLFPGNLERRLNLLDPSKHQFLGPSNMWPDNTLHKTLEFPNGSYTTGIHHPCNGVYCMSWTLVDAIYPLMKDGKFSEMCSSTPDDIAITDLVFQSTGTKLTVDNNFHHQHSKNYKMPFFEPKWLRSSALTLYGFDNLVHLHKILYGGTDVMLRMLPAAAPLSEAAVAVLPKPSARPWWAEVSNLTTLPPKGKMIQLGFNFCRRSSPPPKEINLRVDVGGYESHAHQWCGPPVATASGGEREPLCESRATYKEMHPTHRFNEQALVNCPWTASSIPQSFGEPQFLDKGLRTAIRNAHHPSQVDKPGWATWQYTKGANPRVWAGLAKRLAAIHSPGTCCVANPALSNADGGRCYWTAADQGACLH